MRKPIVKSWSPEWEEMFEGCMEELIDDITAGFYEDIYYIIRQTENRIVHGLRNETYDLQALEDFLAKYQLYLRHVFEEITEEGYRKITAIVAYDTGYGLVDIYRLTLWVADDLITTVDVETTIDDSQVEQVMDNYVEREYDQLAESCMMFIGNGQN